MSTVLSFSKIEKNLQAKFRKQMNNAEDIRDVINGFNYIMTDFLKNIFKGDLEINSSDVNFSETNLTYSLSEKVKKSHEFNNSDIKNILARFAHSASDRYKHLSKHLEKTQLKIRK